jgi:hypothetical protein
MPNPVSHSAASRVVGGVLPCGGSVEGRSVCGERRTKRDKGTVGDGEGGFHPYSRSIERVVGVIARLLEDYVETKMCMSRRLTTKHTHALNTPYIL